MTLRDEPETIAPEAEAEPAPLTSGDLRDRALAAAREAIGPASSEGRFELELASEAEGWSHLYERPRHASRWRLFELAGLAVVELGDGPPRVRFPARDDPPEGADARPEEMESAQAEAALAARAAGRARELRARVVGARATRTSAGRRVTLAVRVLEEVPEGPVEVDVDAIEGAPLAFHVPALLRGSRAGRPLSEAEARARVQAQVRLPEGSALVRAALEEHPAARSWFLRYEVATEHDHGHVMVVAHARTGVVARWASTVRARIVLGPIAARQRAEALVRDALPGVLDRDARLVALVPGLVGRGRKARAGWLGTVTTSQGDVARVSFAGDQVEVALGRRSFRTRVLLP